MGWKTKVALGLVALTVGVIYSKNEAERIKTHFDNIKIIPAWLSDLSLKWNNGFPVLHFKVDFKFINPLPEPFIMNGLFATLKRIIIYDGTGKALGVSTPNIGRLAIPANGVATLPKVPFMLDAKLLLKNILDYKNIKLDSFKFESIISILGTEHKF